MKEPCPPSVLDVKCVALKSFSKFFDHCFRFSRAGMFFLLLVRCAIVNRSLEKVCDKTFTSSDRLFFYLGRMSVDQITWCCNQLLYRSFRMLWRARWHHHRVLLAIDTTDQLFYGRKNEYVHSTVKTRGRKTNGVKVLSFATISIVAKGFKFTLAVVPLRSDERKEVAIEKLIRMIPCELKVHAILMDKGFFYAGAMQTVDRLGYKYIVPTKQYDQMNELYNFFEYTGERHWYYTMNGESKCTFDVYFEDKGIQWYIAFATNIDMTDKDFETLSQIYRYRWNIENGYKDAKEFQIKTRSRNMGYRVLIFTLSHLLMNLHCITKRANRNEVITVSDMKDILEEILRVLMPATRPDRNRLSKRIILAY